MLWPLSTGQFWLWCVNRILDMFCLCWRLVLIWFRVCFTLESIEKTRDDHDFFDWRYKICWWLVSLLVKCWLPIVDPGHCLKTFTTYLYRINQNSQCWEPSLLSVRGMDHIPQGGRGQGRVSSVFTELLLISISGDFLTKFSFIIFRPVDTKLVSWNFDLQWSNT